MGNMKKVILFMVVVVVVSELLGFVRMILSFIPVSFFFFVPHSPIVFFCL